MKKVRKILHITPHLGGGVGRVVINILAASQTDHHIICSLDSINKTAKNQLKESKIEYYENIHDTIDQLLDVIHKVDIVVIHWWNHPLLYDLMVRYTLPECRLLIWAHVSGAQAPQQFSKHLLEYPDYFIFTTPMSYLVNEVSNYQGNHNKLKTIWSTGGLKHIKHVVNRPNERFTIGYIGTVDFAKMYPNFVRLCAQIDIPNIQFIVCGDGGDSEILKQQVEELNVAEKFEFTGHIENIAEYLSRFDLFGYPLNKNHYGTCDQVLAEAMGCGIVPIVFNNNMENYMVHHLYSGIVVNDEKEYVDNIIKLYNNKLLRERLAFNAKEEAWKRFSMEKTRQEWHVLFEKVLKHPKSTKRWKGQYCDTNAKPHEVFLESIGDYAALFDAEEETAIRELSNRSLAWKAKTKGTPYHYYTFFKDDATLLHWATILKT